MTNVKLPSWADFWFAKGHDHIAHDYEMFILAEEYARAAVELNRVVVDDAMVERAIGACCIETKSGRAYFAPETDGDWYAALTAAMAKEE